MSVLKRVATLTAGGTPSVDVTTNWADEGGTNWVTIADMTRDRTVAQTDRCLTAEGLQSKGLKVGRTGTLLFAMYASVGEVAVLGADAAWNQAILGIEPRPGLAESAFVRYWLQHLRPQLTAHFRSNTQDNLNAEQVGNLPFPVVPLATQRVIADYLDAETARIDALIEKKRRMVELLEERVDSLVMSWVGRSGLIGSCDVGSIPLRRVLTKLERWVPEEGEMVTAFRDGEVMARSARRRDGFTDAWTEGARFQVVRVGDVVVHGLDGFSGAIGDSQSDGVCSPIYHVCRPAPGGDPAYYGRLLRLLATSGYLGNFATSTRERAVDFRNWDLFGRIPLPNVPIDDQVRIGNLIRSARPLRDKVRTSEALAMERRQALITAAVTGELPIPGVAA
jgi:type I restriction enzyme, S subunit